LYYRNSSEILQEAQSGFRAEIAEKTVWLFHFPEISTIIKKVEIK